VFQAMPVQPKIAGFISSQQMGITQLAFEYCSALVNDPADRAAFWPDFPWGTSKDTAFNDMTRVTGPLIEKVVGLSLAGQPAPANIEAEVGFLVNNVLRPGSGDTNAIMKGACAAVLGSAAMLVQ
jgi:hypothetical protein